MPRRRAVLARPLHASEPPIAPSPPRISDIGSRIWDLGPADHLPPATNPNLGSWIWDLPATSHQPPATNPNLGSRPPQATRHRLAIYGACDPAEGALTGFQVNIRGCRGSVPVSGPQFHRYGGATTCFEIELESAHRLLVDVGTGALSIPSSLPDGPIRFSVLFTHLHWDHFVGIPFLGPLYDPGNQFDFYGRMVGHMDIEEAIDLAMRPPWFPVNFRSTAAVRRFHPIDDDDGPFQIRDAIVTSAPLHHPDGVSGYRIEWRDATLVIATDIEHGLPESDARLLELAKGADVMFYDAQYLPDEYRLSKTGWGHSTWEHAAAVAQQAGVGQLVLTSHDPSRTDDAIDAIVRQAREVFPNTVGAVEGAVAEVG